MTTRSKPPHNVPVLQRWLTESERSTGIAVARQHRWVSYMVLAGMLEAAAEGEPEFLIKGGVAMELRFDVAARATHDLDLAYRTTTKGPMLDRLDRALATEYQGFTARRGEATRVRGTQTVRCDVKIDYRGRPWATIQVEVAPAEGGLGTEHDRLPAKPLNHLGLSGPGHIPAVSVRWQLAQKLHACTETPVDGRDNDRFRDVIDIILLRDLIPESDYPRVRAACKEIFTLRQLHPWPPTLRPPGGWASRYRALAAEIRFPIEDLDTAVRTVNELVARIAAS